MATAVLTSRISYSESHESASWSGREVTDGAEFAAFLRDVVGPRIADSESGFEDALRGLATTDMAVDQVERLFRAVPDPEDWEIGEAFAECALQSDSGREFHWPWNTVRDRRTPRASLPGADLVGFCTIDDGVWLTFGEVKTSSEATAPPNVMHGCGGMAWQLEESVRRGDIQRTLLQWLHTRCSSELWRTMYEDAVRRFLDSGGRELLAVGVLVRDTVPNEADFRGRGKALAKKLPEPTRIELFAWYLPVPISEWPAVLKGEAL
jgi:hypothetical protein